MDGSTYFLDTKKNPDRSCSDFVFNAFSEVKIDHSWAFADKSRKETAYLTHGFHRYPAKYIPQIVSRLEEKYSNLGDLVVDPFGGCGTTLVESKAMGRQSVGVDINPVAVLIAQAKLTVIEPRLLHRAYADLVLRLNEYSHSLVVNEPVQDRIDYWFKPDQKRKLAFLLAEITQIENLDIRNFFYCAFSNILKSCSIWNQKSNKPVRDYSKIPAEPIKVFLNHCKTMMRGSEDYYNLTKEKGFSETKCIIHCNDARAIPVDDHSASMVITSPPYVTSYEYADLHQLSALWFEYTTNLADFRKRFIGTSSHDKKEIRHNSHIAEMISQKLLLADKKTANEVAHYFTEMNQVFEEMYRVLKSGGRICVVIGNTSLKGVAITNAEVFTEQLINLGFSLEEIIKREIPSKNLPSTRDENTGKFAKSNSENMIYVYPTEYIIVLRK